MIPALQVYYRAFDTVFFKLPVQEQARIQAKIDQLGRRLSSFPHERLTGSNRFRLRVGDYRIIYGIDLTQGVLHLLAMGNRREIYRKI